MAFLVSKTFEVPRLQCSIGACLLSSLVTPVTGNYATPSEPNDKLMVVFGTTELYLERVANFIVFLLAYLLKGKRLSKSRWRLRGSNGRYCAVAHSALCAQGARATHAPQQVPRGGSMGRPHSSSQSPRYFPRVQKAPHDKQLSKPTPRGSQTNEGFLPRQQHQKIRLPGC